MDGNDFRWASIDEPLNYKKWKSTLPDNFGGIENCIQIAGFDLVWNDIDCNVELNIICEQERVKYEIVVVNS